MEPSKPKRASGRLKLVQLLLGFASYLLFVLPYGRRVHGLEKINSRQRYLFVCNHVSLLDTILIGGWFWRAGVYPILVLGAKNAWCDSWLRTWLSRPIGFLLDRGKLNPGRIQELETYGRKISEFHLVVFPEGTRGNGVEMAECQPGVFYVAQAARVPIIPIFIENMQLVSTKNGPFRWLSGLRKVEVHFGDPIAPADYLALSREEFPDFLRQEIMALPPRQPAARLSPVLLRE
jgi:1-acyl-sn-glycerol-3-phosphate acyltransferase